MPERLDFSDVMISDITSVRIDAANVLVDLVDDFLIHLFGEVLEVLSLLTIGKVVSILYFIAFSRTA